MENEPITIEQMASILGGPAPAEPPATVDQPTDPPAQVDPPAMVDPPAQMDPSVQNNPANPPADPTVQLQQQKAQEAFVHLRTQNKQMNDTLKGVAGLLGIDGTDQDSLMNALQAKILEKQAETQHVPVELLQRLQTLEQQNNQFTAQQRQQNIQTGFANVKATYKLDDAQMSKFADDLIASGQNPFVQDIDLNQAYRNLHFDDIVAAKVQEAVAAEQARAAAAINNGSNPGNQQGSQQQGDNITKVNSVREFESWMAQQLSK